MSTKSAIYKLRRMMGFKSSLYKSVFSGSDGELVIADLIRETGWDQQSFVEGHSDTTAFNEGMRRVVTRIIKFVEMTPGDIKSVVNRYDSEIAIYGEDEAA